MTLDRILIGAFAAVIALLAVVAWRKGRFAGPSGLAYATRDRQPGLYRIMMLLHAGTVLFLLVVLAATGSVQ